MHLAEILSKQNSDMTFCYISGAGTDSSGKGRLNWARVKGKTENDLMKLPFKKVFAFRPGFMRPTKGLKNAKGFYAVCPKHYYRNYLLCQSSQYFDMYLLGLLLKLFLKYLAFL